MSDFATTTVITGFLAFLPTLLKAVLVLIACLIITKILMAASGKLLH